MTANLEQLKASVEAARLTLAQAEKDRDNFEPDEDDAHDKYDAWLDELYETPNWLSGSPSCLIKETDPTAYRCGFADWIDGELRNNPEQFDGYKDLCEAVDEAADALEEAESELEDAEDE